MKKILTYKGATLTWECDSNRHMNVMYYINKYEHAGRNFTLEMGLSKEYLEMENMGVIVLEQNIKYLQEVFEDDLLTIETSLLRIGNKSYTLFHEMFNSQSGEKVSTMKIAMVLLDKSSRKAKTFPKEIKERILGSL